MVPSFRVSDSSSLLMSWSGGQGCSSRLDLFGLVWLTAMEFVRPNLSLLDHLLVLDAVLVDGIVITASQKGSFFLKNFETPSLTIEVRNVDELLVGSICIDDLDSSVVMSDKDSTVHNIERGGVVIDVEWDLSDELILSTLTGEHGEHVVFTSGDESALRASNSGDFTSVGF